MMKAIVLHSQNVLIVMLLYPLIGRQNHITQTSVGNCETKLVVHQFSCNMLNFISLNFQIITSLLKLFWHLTI